MMVSARKKLKISILVLSGIGIFFALVFVFLKLTNPSKAALLVESSPVAAVYINGDQVGRTPFTTSLPPGEITVKIVPESTKTPMVPYQTQVNLIKGVKTVIRWTFGETKETSSGEVVTFRETGTSASSITIASIPDGVGVKVDNVDQGKTPIKVNSVVSGNHTITLSQNGYKDLSFDIVTINGYGLVAIASLAVGQSDQVVPTASPTPYPGIKVNQVVIGVTPTGFLRVRSNPSSLAPEVGKVNPGEIYNIIETDAKSGWYKIEIKQGVVGWVSNQYSKKVSTPSPSPSTKP